MPLGRPPTEKRNLDIWRAVEDGASIADVAAKYQLTSARVQAILIGERHKIAVSPSPEYRALRANPFRKRTIQEAASPRAAQNGPG